MAIISGISVACNINHRKLAENAAVGGVMKVMALASAHEIMA